MKGTLEYFINKLKTQVFIEKKTNMNQNYKNYSHFTKHMNPYTQLLMTHMDIKSLLGSD